MTRGGGRTRTTNDQHAEAMEDMRMIRGKLRSDKGASITFALLIFLVCAIVSSAVIVAATTAAGRLSTMDEMDERYYAVTEACELLCDTFDGQTVNATYTLKDDGSVDTITTDTANAILRDATERLIREDTNPYGPITQEMTTAKGQTYTCSITETLNRGTLTFDVSAAGGKTNSGVYRLSVIFASNVKRTYEGSAGTGYKAVVTWKLRSLKKNRPTVTVKPTEST